MTFDDAAIGYKISPSGHDNSPDGMTCPVCSPILRAKNPTLTPVGEAQETLRKTYPNGHPKFFDISLAEMKLHSEKNHDYARGGHPLGNFQRVVKVLENYPGLKVSDQKTVAVMYIMKQFDAVLWMLSNGYDGQVEGMSDRLRDISVYAKIIMCMLADEKKMTLAEQLDMQASAGSKPTPFPTRNGL